jgi:uncharacterized protein
MRVLVRLIAGLLALGVTASLAVVLLHRSYLYPFSDQAFSIAGFVQEPVPVTGQPDLPVQVFHAADPAAPVIIYFMGNAGALQIFERPLTQMRDAGFSVVAMPYRGGGGVPGQPTEARLIADALAVFDWTQGWAEGPIVLRGYSLGTGLALAVAAEREADTVILTAPYTRLCTLIADRIVLPACVLPGIDKWDSVARAARVSERVLILHGTADALVPFAMGEALAEVLRTNGADVIFVPIAGGDHVSLDLDPAYGAAVDGFMAGVE